MKKYNVSLRKPNKKYAIKKEDRIIRIKNYLKNIWTVRKNFIDKYGVDPTVINGDQMPLHRNKSASQKTSSLKLEEVFGNENYMLSSKRGTCFTQPCSDPKIELNLCSKEKVHKHTSLLQKVYIINGRQKDLTELNKF